MTDRPVVPVVLAQHLEDCIALRETRSVLLRSLHLTLVQLARLDERLRAHLDGLAVAGPAGEQAAREALATPGVGSAFTAAALALMRGDDKALAPLVALARSEPHVWRGLVSALGWVPAASLRQVAAGWFATPDRFLRRLGLAACLVHQVDPGALLAGAIESDDAALRAVAARASGELGRLDLKSACLALLDDADPAMQALAARSAILLGDRGRALDVCHQLALAPGPNRKAALVPALLAADRRRARTLLDSLAQQRDEKQPATIRLLIRAVGLAGDTHFADWLIGLMSDPQHARLAGESFTLITGADLALLDLERRPPQDVPGPTDDAADSAVALDEDDGAAWPDPARVWSWWSANKVGFAAGARTFMGTAPDAPNVERVLRDGRNRQRQIAALHRALAAPGSMLFNTSAPAWRQQRALAHA